MIRFIFIISTAVLSACSFIGSTRTAMIDDIPGPNIFKPMCIGRYQMDMPKGTTVVDGTFRSFDLVGSFVSNRSKESQYGGYFEGVDRESKWEKWVQKEVDKRRGRKAEYIINRKESGRHALATNFLSQDERHTADMLETYIFKDFKHLNSAISLKGRSVKTTYVRSEITNYKPHYRRFFDRIYQASDLYKHQPWPHNQLGVCLDKNITFNTAKAADDEYLRVIYRYGQKTFFQFYFDAYPAGSYGELQDDISRKLGLLSMFASDYFTFGGHAGKLFLSSDRYNPEATRFRWYATDAKAGSTRNPYISIEGRVDINDFPEYRNMNNIDSDAIALAILSSLRPRENGLVGTK
ncbi:hypothetical protein [Pelagibaculum spongiae]|uniref:Tle cognate immunity protein 4 C-terminal domain-containing protein n=1 Tax=Pelagibaculum spongiae TaxID=2080658 RepID=A0A2V1H475_9GAMM|nr:hypothetical protein [Pelagibaculum spongiae]PVZ72028.1 hypothetical protein DC094_03130 [Pelagibaculum spongiae]